MLYNMNNEGEKNLQRRFKSARDRNRTSTPLRAADLSLLRLPISPPGQTGVQY